MVETTEMREQLSVRTRIVRITAFAMPVTVILFAILVVTGIGGFRGGWLWAPAIAAPASAAVGWWGWGRGRGRPVATVAVVLSGIAFGLWISQESLLSHGRLRAAMNSIPVPTTFEYTGDTSGGWSLCADECPSYTRHWVAAGDAEEVQAQLREVLEDEGFVLGEWGTRRPQLGTATVEGHRGRLRVLVGVDTRWARNHYERLPLAPGQVGITAILETYSAD